MGRSNQAVNYCAFKKICILESLTNRLIDVEEYPGSELSSVTFEDTPTIEKPALSKFQIK